MRKQIFAAGRVGWMLVFVWGLMVLSGLMLPTERALAYSVEVTYYLDGLDLDLGTVELDPTVVVILMGENIEKILEPNLEKLNDFRPSIDVGIRFHPDEEEQVQLLLQHGAQAALVEAGTEPGNLTGDLLGGLEFTGGAARLPLTADTLLVVRTGEQRYYTLRLEELADFAVKIDYAELKQGSGNPGAVPEPSTFLLLALGMLGGMAGLKRKRGANMVLLVLLGSLLGSPAAFGQEEPITITKTGSSGDGTILYGDFRCEPGCTEFTIPYSKNSGAVLKAIPAEGSRFTYWKTSGNQLLEGEWQVEPGDTVVALFQDKRELFADDLRFSGAPPEVAQQEEIARGRYVMIFQEVLLNEEIIILNLFDDVMGVAVREELEEDEDIHFWYGTLQNDELSTISFGIGKKSQTVFGSLIINGIPYKIDSTKSSDAHVLFEIDTDAIYRQHQNVSKQRSSESAVFASLAKGIQVFFNSLSRFSAAVSPMPRSRYTKLIFWYCIPRMLSIESAIAIN